MSESDRRYILFRVCGRRFALDVDAVAEISELLPEYPIPNAPDCLRGVVNIHGRVAAVLDLPRFLGEAPTGVCRSLVLLNSGGSALALLVEQMERMVGSTDISAIQQVEDKLSLGELVLADGNATLLDIEGMLSSLEKTFEM